MTVSMTIDLSAPRLSLTTSVAVREAAKAALDAGATHYTDRPGIADLREAVALKLAEVNRIAVAPADEVLITCGIQEALFLALQVLAGTGNEVIITGPALRADVELVRMVGAVARIAPADDRLRLDIDGIRDLISDDTKVLLLRSPSGSGEVLCDETLERLGALAVEHDLRVVAVETDEALTAADVDPQHRRRRWPRATHRDDQWILGPWPRSVAGRLSGRAARADGADEAPQAGARRSAAQPCRNTPRSMRSADRTTPRTPCATGSMFAGPRSRGVRAGRPRARRRRGGDVRVRSAGGRDAGEDGDRPRRRGRDPGRRWQLRRSRRVAAADARARSRAAERRRPPLAVAIGEIPAQTA